MPDVLWMGQRNPAPPKGWLKPQQNHGINHLSTGDFATAHPQYQPATIPWLMSFPNQKMGEFGEIISQRVLHEKRRSC
jgi:hypothetical protein